MAIGWNERKKSTKSELFSFFFLNKGCGRNEHPEEEEKLVIMGVRGENLKLWLKVLDKGLGEKIDPTWDTMRNNIKWSWEWSGFVGKEKRKKRWCFHNGFMCLVGVNKLIFWEEM